MREVGAKWLKVLEKSYRTSATLPMDARLRNNAGEILRCSLSLLRIESRLVPIAGLAAMIAT